MQVFQLDDRLEHTFKQLLEIAENSRVKINKDLIVVGCIDHDPDLYTVFELGFADAAAHHSFMEIVEKCMPLEHMTDGVSWWVFYQSEILRSLTHGVILTMRNSENRDFDFPDEFINPRIRGLAPLENFKKRGK